jgi:hypothetical protein
MQTEHRSEISGLRPMKRESWQGLITDLQPACSGFGRLLIHMILPTIAMVTAIQRQHSSRVSGLPKTASLTVQNLETVLEHGKDYDF